MIRGVATRGKTRETKETISDMLTWVDRILARMTRLLSTGKLADTLPCLDLHELGVKEALAQTAKFLDEASRAGSDRVRIVYGKGRHSEGGRGILREAVPRWLAGEGRRWVASFSPVLEPTGEEGSVEVRLKGSGSCRSRRRFHRT